MKMNSSPAANCTGRLLNDFSKSRLLNNDTKFRQLRSFESLPLHNVLALTGQRLSFKESIGLIQTNSLELKKFNSILITDVRQCGERNYDEILKHLINSKELVRNKHQKYVIASSNRLKFLFDFLMTMVTLYSVITSLYYLSFTSQTSNDSFVDWCVWGLFMVDFLLNFITEREDYHGHKLRNIRLIAKYYGRRFLLLDLLALIPLRLFNHPHTEYFLRLTRIFKLHRMFDMVNIHYFSSALAKVASGGKERKRKYLNILLINLWDLFRALIVIIFTSYCLACLWHWYVGMIIRRFNEPNSFFKAFSLLKDSPLNQLIKTWYFIFSTLATIGYGDFLATNKYEMMLCIIICITGSTWFAFMSSKILNIVKNLRELNGFSTQSMDLAVWMSSIEKKHKRIPNKLKQKINNFFSYFWKNDRLGSLANFTPEHEIENPDCYLLEMPEVVKFEILDFLFEDIFYKFTYFFGRNNSWKYEACLHFQPRIFVKGEVILNFEEEVHEVLFMTTGEFEMMITQNGELHRICSLKRSTIIGDYFVFKKINSFLRYKAIETADCFSIPASVILRLAEQYKVQFTMYFQAVSHNIENLIDTIPSTLETQNSQGPAIIDQEFHENSKNDIKVIDYPQSCFRNVIKRMKTNKEVSIMMLKERLIKMCMRNLCRENFSIKIK